MSDTFFAIIESAEHPAVYNWLEQWDTKYDEATESAAEVAEKIADEVAHFDKMLERLRSGSSVDMILATHRTSTEPFLIGFLDPPLSINELKEGGGSLGLLEGWDLEITSDEQGQKEYIVYFRGKKYQLNIDKLRKSKENSV